MNWRQWIWMFFADSHGWDSIPHITDELQNTTTKEELLKMSIFDQIKFIKNAKFKDYCYQRCSDKKGQRARMKACYVLNDAYGW